MYRASFLANRATSFGKPTSRKGGGFSSRTRRFLLERVSGSLRFLGGCFPFVKLGGALAKPKTLSTGAVSLLFFRLRWFERVYLPSLGMVLLFWLFVRGHQS